MWEVGAFIGVCALATVCFARKKDHLDLVAVALIASGMALILMTSLNP